MCALLWLEAVGVPRPSWPRPAHRFFLVRFFPASASFLQVRPEPSFRQVGWASKKQPGSRNPGFLNKGGNDPSGEETSLSHCLALLAGCAAPLGGAAVRQERP